MEITAGESVIPKSGLIVSSHPPTRVALPSERHEKLAQAASTYGNWSMKRPIEVVRWFFDPQRGPTDRLLPRWLFLRALGLIYFSAFFSLIFQIRGLIGPQGILPANEYLQVVARSMGYVRGAWFAPTLLWFSSGSHMLVVLCWAGMWASILVVFNIWPRGNLLICFVCFLSFVSAAQDFSSYQSDGMLLEAGFIALFFAPAGFFPRVGRSSPPSRASLFLLQWEWFRIYFESGVAKILGGDPEWRHLTAMDEYYQNGPLPTWIGWYVQHMPHWFHVSTAFATLALELVLVWMLFLPRRWRLVCFLIVTPWEIAVILTANYTFLNYLVLSLGILLLDDGYLRHLLPGKWNSFFARPLKAADSETRNKESSDEALPSDGNRPEESAGRARPVIAGVKFYASALVLGWILCVTTVELIWMFGNLPFPAEAVEALEPFRIANRYGLFGIMTRGRYEVEFQGSDDGTNWITYPFRYKPQDSTQAPRIYAPYQPRFDWNLWFASLGSWREYSIVPRTELRLITNDRDVLYLFAANPFPKSPPREVRAVLWQYWFTTLAEKKKTGMWWRRKFVGLYAPTIQREPDGSVHVVEWPGPMEPRSDW